MAGCSAALLAGCAFAEMPRLTEPGADFGSAKVSADARTLADWSARTGDHAGLGFVIVDKKTATLHVFDAKARLQASTPVLLGAARGDRTPPGIGLKPIAEVRPHERITPAGRFIAERGRNAKGKDVVWVDYDAGVSMHRVIDDDPAEQRPQRLATPSVADNRISYGCINIPVRFYEQTLRPMFRDYRAVVYILPEAQPLRQVFDLDGATRVAGAMGSPAAPQ